MRKKKIYWTTKRKKTNIISKIEKEFFERNYKMSFNYKKNTPKISLKRNDRFTLSFSEANEDGDEERSFHLSSGSCSMKKEEANLIDVNVESIAGKK